MSVLASALVVAGVCAMIVGFAQSAGWGWPLYLLGCATLGLGVRVAIDAARKNP